jgi:hypothetical protein
MDDFDDVEDGFDETCNANTRQTLDEEFEASGRKLPHKTGPGSIRKLADERWSDHLDNERDVIRKAKAGDKAALELFYRAFNKACIKVASQYGGPPYEERLSAAIEGCFKALKGYDLGSNNGFFAYAIKFIVGEVVDLVHDWHQRGGKLETVDERESRKTGQFFRPLYAEYNGIEKRYDDYGSDADGNPTPKGNKITGWISVDEAEPTWDETRLRLSRRLAKLGRRLGVPRECIGVDENPNRNGGRYPKKIIGTPGFQIKRASGVCEQGPTPPQYQADASRIRGTSSPLGIIGWLAQDTERRAKRRFDRLGRRAYAHWHSRRPCRMEMVMVMDWPPIEPQQTKTYSISINTARTASDSSDWKDASARLQSARVPTVWEQRDKSGHWRVIDLRPKEPTFESTAALAA